MAKKSAKAQKEKLFEETFVPGAAGSGKLFDVSYESSNSMPVECLGLKFPNDDARRRHFKERLKEKLLDSEFLSIDGFPVGDIEDILELSDPPYYTACPNPFLNELLQNRKTSKPNIVKRPFAEDVAANKRHQIYTAHSYHTKVPHEAIVRYILYYTRPGDVVLDGFGGTGMTGVAVQCCANPDPTLKAIVEEEWQARFSKSPSWGVRTAICSDISPMATFMQANYTRSVDVNRYLRSAKDVEKELRNDCGWMYQTTLDNGTQAEINYTVWSDVFVCPSCSESLVFWEACVDEKTGEIQESFACPACKAKLSKKDLELNMVAVRDSVLQKAISQSRITPVLINYISDRRGEKRPGDSDLEILRKVETSGIQTWVPSARMPPGREGRRNDKYGITHVHHFFTQRNLHALSKLFELINSEPDDVRLSLKFVFTAAFRVVTRRSLFLPNARVQGGTGPFKPSSSGTLYVPSLTGEKNPVLAWGERINQFEKLFSESHRNSKEVYVTTQSSTDFRNIPDGSIDYIFVDPPFGENIQYSELNFIWEAWLKVRTNIQMEAIQDRTQDKSILDYQNIMADCFSEFYRCLKHQKWMTIVFHNSKNAIWAAIQEALQRAGFVIADVRTLDKKQGTFVQYNTPGAVKQDLVISAYKPDEKLLLNFGIEQGSERGVWEFVRNHLEQLPIYVETKGRLEVVAERLNYLLFDRMVAFHVQHNVSISVSASEFYQGLREKFPEREGMYFLPDQVSEYDQKRLAVSSVEQLRLFVSDEKSAIQWVRHHLKEQIRTFRDLQPIYMKEAQQAWGKHEQPVELKTILEQNFVQDRDDTWRIPDPKSEADLEQLRHRALLREFQQYVDAKGKLKVVRSEALRAGFKEAWQKKDYVTIIQMVKRVPDAVVQEDSALLMYYDNASLLIGE
jgi:DNA modification methylase